MTRHGWPRRLVASGALVHRVCTRCEHESDGTTATLSSMPHQRTRTRISQPCVHANTHVPPTHPSRSIARCQAPCDVGSLHRRGTERGCERTHPATRSQPACWQNHAGHVRPRGRPLRSKKGIASPSALPVLGSAPSLQLLCRIGCGMLCSWGGTRWSRLSCSSVLCSGHSSRSHPSREWPRGGMPPPSRSVRPVSLGIGTPPGPAAPYGMLPGPRHAALSGAGCPSGDGSRQRPAAPCVASSRALAQSSLRRQAGSRSRK